MLNYQRVDLFEDMVSKIPWLIFPWKNWLTFWVSHMFGQTHMIMVVFSRHIPQSLHDHIPILSHCVLYMYTVFTYTYIRMYIYIYTYIHVFMIFPTNLWWFPASTRFTPTSVESFFFQRQGALLLALPLYQTNGVTGEPLGPRAKKRKGPQIEMDKHV